MQILFITQLNVYPIESNGIYQDLLEEFSQNHHKVTIMNVTLDQYHPKTLREGNVKYLFIQNGSPTQINPFQKIINYVTLIHKLHQTYKKNLANKSIDLILYATPPIFFSSLIAKIRKKTQAISYLMLKDIFPQNAVDLGMFSKLNPIYWYFRHKEKHLYRVSDVIGVMSQGNMDYLVKHNPQVSKKIEICPNAINIDKLKESNIDHELLDYYGLPKNKSLVIYGGNLGKPQNIDFIIECLKAHEYLDSTHLVLIGSGTEFRVLKDYFDTHTIEKSTLLESISFESYHQLLRFAKLGLVFLDYRFTIPNFPSRILSYMRLKIPILAATDPVTDLRYLIEENELGAWVRSDNPKTFIKTLKRLMADPKLNDYGINGYDYLMNHFQSQYVYQKIMSKLTRR